MKSKTGWGNTSGFRCVMVLLLIVLTGSVGWSAPPSSQEKRAQKLSRRALAPKISAHTHRTLSKFKTEDHVPHPSTSDVEPRFSVGKRGVVMLPSDREERAVPYLDAGLYGLKDGDSFLWIGTNPNRAEGTVVSRGPKSDPYKRMLATELRIEGVEEHAKGAKHAGNTAWIANLYRDAETGNIIVFVHLEYKNKSKWDKSDVVGSFYGRLGLAISKDNGKSFQWLGYIIAPNVKYRDWQDAIEAGEKKHTNTGLCSYIVKDDYFYLYYRDTNEKSGEFGLAVARVRIEDLTTKAAQGQVTPWKKYYKGQWEEDGIEGRFTPLNIPPLGSMHGDAAYNSHLEKYILVVRYGKRHGGPKGSLLISCSDDGLEWSEWKTVHSDMELHDYPSIVSEGDDNEVTGRSFWIYFRYIWRPKAETSRIRVTLE
jgi:hypothetical protein